MKETNNKQKFHLTYHRSFSERTLTANCLGKEEVLEKIKKLQKTTSMLGPTIIKEIFELVDGEKKLYQIVQAEKDLITDIQPVIHPSA